MFVNPISNFNFAGASRMQALKDNAPQTDAPKPNPAPSEEKPQMKSQLMHDTVSFGESKKDKAGRSLRNAAMATIAAGSMASCVDLVDAHFEDKLENHLTVNLSDYHKCHCDSVPIITPGRDTIYVPVPGDKDTIYVPIPGKNDTIYIDRPGEVVHDTIVMPGTTDTIFVDRPVHDTIYVDVPKNDTIWLKPDTVFIEKEWDYNNPVIDSIYNDANDLDIPVEGEGKIPVRMVGENEYLNAVHDLRFNGFFSSKSKVSYIDHAFERDDYDNDKKAPSKYYYTRYDVSAAPTQGRCLVQVYEPVYGINHLPSKEDGEAGWVEKRRFYVQNQSKGDTKQVIAQTLEKALKARYTPNTVRGKGNVYKEWPLEDGQMPKTTIVDAKIYRGKFED